MNNYLKSLILILIINIGNFTSCQQNNFDTSELFLNSIDNSKENISQKTQRELVVIQPTSILNLNPHTSSNISDYQILSSVYEGLFSCNGFSSQPEFAIAKNYTTSRNQLHWTFFLKENACFSDGTKITSNDFKESWLDLLSTPGAYYSSSLDIIKGAKEYRLGKGKREDVAIHIKDENTFSIELTSPLSYLPMLLCHYSFSVIKKDKDVFSGAYKITSFTNENIILEKNPFYYSAQAINIPRVKIIFSDDPDTNAYLFNTGKAHWVLAPCNTQKLLDKSTIKIDLMYGTYFFFFKLGNNPYLTEKLRLALMDATPWEKLREGSLFPATRFVPAITNYPQPAPLNYTDYDHADLLAKQAKTELGLKEDEIIDLTFAIPEGEGIHKAALILQDAWKKIGINLNIKVIKGSYYSQISKLKSDLLLYTWIGDFIDPCAFLDLFRSGSTLNESNWKCKEYDQLLDKANATQNQVERLSILAKAEDLLLSSAMIFPITHSISINIVNFSELGGWVSNPQDLHLFKNLYFKDAKSNYDYGIIVKK